jgi:glucosyl-3-phosphoglycerate phosphatase
MNDHLAQPGKEWGTPGFVDPGLWDTSLTPAGEDQARVLNEQLKLAGVHIDLLVASPLRRALQTADIAFADVRCHAREVTPLAAERCFLSSDVGSPLDELKRRHGPEWGLDSLSDGWWYQADDSQGEWRPPGEYLYAGEPDTAFYSRMRRLLAYLRSKAGGGGCVALVAHWGVIYALTGRSLQNAECITLASTELTAEPFRIPD